MRAFSRPTAVFARLESRITFAMLKYPVRGPIAAGGRTSARTSAGGRAVLAGTDAPVTNAAAITATAPAASTLQRIMSKPFRGRSHRRHGAGRTAAQTNRDRPRETTPTRGGTPLCACK